MFSIQNPSWPHFGHVTMKCSLQTFHRCLAQLGFSWRSLSQKRQTPNHGSEQTTIAATGFSRVCIVFVSILKFALCSRLIPIVLQGRLSAGELVGIADRFQCCHVVRDDSRSGQIHVFAVAAVFAHRPSYGDPVLRAVGSTRRTKLYEGEGGIKWCFSSRHKKGERGESAATRNVPTPSLLAVRDPRRYPSRGSCSSIPRATALAATVGVVSLPLNIA